MAKDEYMMLNYFDDIKYFIYSVTIVLRQKSRESIGVAVDRFSYCENLDFLIANTHSVFKKFISYVRKIILETFFQKL